MINTTSSDKSRTWKTRHFAYLFRSFHFLSRMDIKWSKAYFAEAAPTTLNTGDKIVLPSSALEEILSAANNNSENLPSPLTFELRHPHTRSIVYGGVKEFSGTGDTVQLPSWMMESLQIEPMARVVIKFKSLPKGTWAKLRPLSRNATDITDYRAALESHLRSHYNTMATGQILTCRYGSQSYPFLVTDLKPESAVCITDTDLEVDLEPFDQEQPHVMTQQQQQKTTIALNEIVQSLTIEEDQYRYWELQLGGGNQKNVDIQMTVESGDAGK